MPKSLNQKLKLLHLKRILEYYTDVDHGITRKDIEKYLGQQFFAWVFGLGKSVRIAGPESVKEQMKTALADIAARYEE